VRFDHLKQIPTLRNYILVSQDRPRIECFTRQDDASWPCLIAEGVEAPLFLATLDCELVLSEVYAQVPFLPSDRE
jgi:hypothetical protein